MDWTEVLRVGGEPAGPARRRAAGQHRLRQHRSAGPGVCGAGGGCRATFFNYRRKLTGGKETSQEPTS